MKKIIIIVVLIILLVGGYLLLNYFINKDLKEQEEQYQDLINQYGYVNKENVNLLVAKFNTEVMNNSINYPASEEYFAVEDGIYWYGLYDDIYLYIEPLEYTNDQNKDIVDLMAINFPKNSVNQEMALKYAKCLIKANNQDITDEEIDELIQLAKEKSKDKGVANNGTGLTVALAEDDSIYEYQVVRLYK